MSMTTDPIYRRLLELSWRRPLTAAENQELRACLATNADAALEWEADSAINRALGGVRDVPVPNNFTARVMAAVERQQKVSQSSRRTSALWRALSLWLPRTAAAAVILGVGLIAY